MPEDTRVHPIYFDSEVNGDFTDMGLPYRIVEESSGLDLMLSLHISGVFQYRVVNDDLFRMYGETEGFLQRSLINSLPGVLADSEGGFGLPKELPAHAKEIGDALVSRLSWTWTDRYGVVLEHFAVTDCRLTESSCAEAERALAAAHADDALREKLGLRRRQRPAQQRPADQQQAQQPNSSQRPQNPQRPQTSHQTPNPAEEIQQVVSKLVSSWQAALEKSKSSAIPTTPPGARTGPKSAWRCTHCGRYNVGRFCSECGSRRVWFCPQCDKRNISNFCMNCGFKEP